MIRKKSCALCGAHIHFRHVVCKVCFDLYKGYLHEPWFTELAAMQSKQDFIDSVEAYTVYDDEEMVKAGAILQLKNAPPIFKNNNTKDRGRPRLNTELREKVHELRKTGLSHRRIAQIVKVSRETVRRILTQ